MSEGWIKLHRKLFDHWLWDNKPKSKFEAWLWIIQRANHDDNKFMLGNQLIDVKRGQIITSEKKMMALFKWSKSKLRNFLKTLENESMIEIKRDSKKTTLTVSNYSVYQERETSKKPVKDQQKTTERLLKDTNKNVKNEDNVKKKDIILKPENVTDQTWDDFKKHRNKKKAIITQNVINGFESQAKIAGWTLENALNESIERGWTGFKAEWVNKSTSQQNKPAPKQQQERTYTVEG